MANRPKDNTGRTLARRLVAVFAVPAILLAGTPAGAQETIPPEETTTTTTAEQSPVAEPTTPQDAPAAEQSPAAEPTTAQDAPAAEPPEAPTPSRTAEPSPVEEQIPAEDDAAAEEQPAEEPAGEDEGRWVTDDEVPDANASTDPADEGADDEPPVPASRMSRMAGPGLDPDWFTESPAPNPPMPTHCGLNMAIVFDVSGSIGAKGVRQSKDAGLKAIDELSGTPATLGIYNFASKSPIAPGTTGGPYSMTDAGDIATARANVNALHIPTERDVYGNRLVGTNWDGGLSRIPVGVYDVVYFITDGPPNTNDAWTARQPHGPTHAAHLTDAIEAANALKRGGARIVPFSVKLPQDPKTIYGNDIDQLHNTPVPDRIDGRLYRAGSRIYRWDADKRKLTEFYTDADGIRQRYRNHPELWLAGSPSKRYVSDMVEDISSPGTPVYVRDYRQLADALVKRALAGCRGRIDVTKRIVDDQGNELSRGEGWEFTATATSPVLEDDSVDPVRKTSTLTRNADAEGRVGFRINADDPQEVTIAETPQEGMVLRPRDGGNAVCFTSVDGKRVPVEVRNVGADGFAVTVPKLKGRLGAVDCVVDNVKSPAPAARKEPVLGEPVQVNPDGTAELDYTITLSNPSASTEAAAGELFDIVRLPADVVAAGDATVAFAEVDGVEVTGPVESIPRAELTRDNRVRLAESATLAPGKELTVRVTIPVQVEDIDGADWDRLGRCEGDGSTVSPVGVPNSVELAGDEDPADDNACIPLTPPKQAVVNIAKVDNEDTLTPLDGSEFALFGSTPDGAIDWDNRISGGPGNGRLAEGVHEGRYHLVETKAPEGYALLASPVAVQVTGHAEGYTIALADDADGGLVAVGPADAADAADELWVRVADLTAGTLPKTGGTGPAPFALAALLAFAAAGVLGARRRRG